MGWGWPALGSGAVGTGGGVLLSRWPPLGAPVWSMKRPVSPHTPRDTARSCPAPLGWTRQEDRGWQAGWAQPRARDGRVSGGRLQSRLLPPPRLAPPRQRQPQACDSVSGARPLCQGLPMATALPASPWPSCQGAEHRGPPTPHPELKGHCFQGSRAALYTRPESSVQHLPRPHTWGQSRNFTDHPSSCPRGHRPGPLADWILCF